MQPWQGRGLIALGGVGAGLPHMWLCWGHSIVRPVVRDTAAKASYIPGHPSTLALEKQLKTYFDELNRHPKPIQWTYTKTKLLAKFGTSQPAELAA